MVQPEILIQPNGRLANQMFQMMIALQIQRRTGMGEILGYKMPEWKLVSRPVPDRERRSLVLHGHHFDLDYVAYILRSGLMDAVYILGWGMRLPYFGNPAPYRNLFQTSLKGEVLADDELLIHIRGEDILSGWHHHYFPLPFSFYENVIGLTGLRPVFMGQLDDNEFSSALKRRFPEARYLPQRSVIEDFMTLRNAAHVVLSVSSYAWLATWLSEKAKTIHLPVAGLFSPLNRETFLLPIGDPRYEFYKVSMPDPEARKKLNFLHWVETHPFEGILDLGGLRGYIFALAAAKKSTAADVPSSRAG